MSHRGGCKKVGHAEGQPVMIAEVRRRSARFTSPADGADALDKADPLLALSGNPGADARHLRSHQLTHPFVEATPCER